MKINLFLPIILLLGSCSTPASVYWENKKPLPNVRTHITETIDSMQSGGVTYFFTKTHRIDSIWYEDTEKLRKINKDIDSIKKSTYLVTQNMTRYQEKQQKAFDFYKGVTFVTGSVVLVTGIWWLLNGR